MKRSSLAARVALAARDEDDMPFRLRAKAIAVVVLCSTGGLAAQGDLEKLKDPSQLNERAPDLFRARFDTSQGTFVIAVEREWAPLAADRFYNLVKNGFYNDTRFFRVLDGFMAQFGLACRSGRSISMEIGEPEGRTSHEEQHARVRQLHSRVEPEFALHDDLHQLQGQQLSGRRRVRSIRAGGERHGRRRPAVQRIWPPEHSRTSGAFCERAMPICLPNTRSSIS